MNLQFLGDALDHWKGSVFEQLQQAKQLIDFQVDAMASDSDKWTLGDWSLFASLLRVTPSQIVRHKANLNKTRDDYFAEVPRNGDLFLDPDTGIMTGTVKDICQYLKPCELVRLLEADQSRMLVVYQHIRAQRTRDRIEQVLAAVRAGRKVFCCASYESGTVAMLFFSLDKSRVASLERYYRAFLGKHADRRIGLWT
jgi:hypothetical protein